MGDEDAFMEEDVAAGGDLEVGKKVGFLPAALIRILTWVALGLAAIIFIVTVVILTMNIVLRDRQSVSAPPVSEEYVTKPPRLDYNEVGEIRTRTADPEKYMVILTPSVGFDGDNKQLANEVVQRKPEMIHYIRSTVSQMTAKQIENEAELLETLKTGLNRILSEGRIQNIILTDLQIIY